MADGTINPAPPLTVGETLLKPGDVLLIRGPVDFADALAGMLQADGLKIHRLVVGRGEPYDDAMRRVELAKALPGVRNVVLYDPNRLLSCDWILKPYGIDRTISFGGETDFPPDVDQPSLIVRRFDDIEGEPTPVVLDQVPLDAGSDRSIIINIHPNEQEKAPAANRNDRS